MDLTWVGAAFSACTITALFAWIGFNRPSWSRSYTSAARYRYAIAGHITLYLLVLLVVYAFLRRGFAAYAQIDALTTEPLPSALVWIALGLTLCARAVPPLSTRTRTWLQRLAGIPSHAQRFATLLAHAELTAAPSVRENVRDMLLSRGIDAEGDWLPLAQPTHRLLVKATALFIQLRHWEHDPRFARFVFEAKNDLDLLRRRFDRLSFHISRTFTLIERLGEVRYLYAQQGAETAAASDKLDGLLRRIAGDLIADSCEDIGAFYDDACLLAARGAMATQSTRRGRDALIARLGFVIEHRARPAAYGILAYAAVLLYFGMWFFFLILPVGTADIEKKALVSVVSLIVFGSMAIAIVPKLHWGFANAGLHERTPVRFVVGAGACALLFAVGVHLVAGALLKGGAAGALQRLLGGSPYLPAVFLTAATIAWLVQDHRWRGTPSPRMRRLRDAAALGSVWLLSSIVGNLLRAQIFSVPIDPLYLLEAAASGFVFGGVVGYAIPESVRVVQMRSSHEAPVTSADFATPTDRQAAA